MSATGSVIPLGAISFADPLREYPGAISAVPRVFLGAETGWGTLTSRRWGYRGTVSGIDRGDFADHPRP